MSAVPYSWVLFDLWRDSPSLFRTAELDGYAATFMISRPERCFTVTFTSRTVPWVPKLSCMTVESSHISACFLLTHPDARALACLTNHGIEIRGKITARSLGMTQIWRM